MMRDIYKNPMFYYLAVPAVLGLWPLLVWAKYLPAAKANLDKEGEQYSEAKTLVNEILTLDPEILMGSDQGMSLGKFTYADAVDQVANLCHIPSNKCNLSADRIAESSGKKVQGARVELEDVTIVQTASFLSGILSDWVNLTCERAKLIKKEGVPDQWDVDLRFNYDY